MKPGELHPHDLRRRDAAGYQQAIDGIETTFVRYPIPLLQVVGTEPIPFVYHVDWGEGQTIGGLRRTGTDSIRLLPGAAENLVRYGPLLRPLIEQHWVRDVATWSQINNETETMREHLFGSQRRGFSDAFRSDLIELQDGHCFYCQNRLTTRVDLDNEVRSLGLAQSSYEFLREGTPLWVHEKDFVIATGPIRIARTDGEAP